MSDQQFRRKIQILVEFSLGKEDFRKLLNVLVEWSKEKKVMTFWDIMETLYKQKDSIGFEKYFKNTYWVHNKPFDILLERDIGLLHAANILTSNGNGFAMNLTFNSAV